MERLGFACILGPFVLWAASCFSVWALAAFELGFGCIGFELLTRDLLGASPLVLELMFSSLFGVIALLSS